MLPPGQGGNGLSKGVTEIGILGAAAITSPPGGVDSELHEVGKAPKLVGAGRLAASQSAKAIEIDRVRAL
jgi:hypothetical protein